MRGVIPEKSLYCSPLQPTLTWQFQSGVNSWKVLPLQLIAAHSYLAISVRGVIPEKSSHCSPTLTSFYPLWTNYPHNLTSIYPPWQPNSYIILPPLDKLPPHSYFILPPLAAQLLHHFNPSGQITPLLLNHFIPIGSPTLTSFYLLWTNHPLTLKPFYPPWQPD